MPIRDLGVPFLRRFRPPTLHRLQREQKIRPLQKRLHAEVRGTQVCPQLTKFSHVSFRIIFHPLIRTMLS